MDCLSIWQAGHYLAKWWDRDHPQMGNNGLAWPESLINSENLAKFCVNLYRLWTPSSSFDHHQESAQSWLSKTHQQDLDLTIQEFS